MSERNIYVGICCPRDGYVWKLIESRHAYMHGFDPHGPQSLSGPVLEPYFRILQSVLPHHYFGSPRFSASHPFPLMTLSGQSCRLHIVYQFNTDHCFAVNYMIMTPLYNYIYLINWGQLVNY